MRSRLIHVLAIVISCAHSRSEEESAAAHFRKDIEPLLSNYCYDCHADGEKKGNVVFDEFKSDDALLGGRDLWLSVLKNMRAGLMPPKKKPQPSAKEREKIEKWIKFEAFG